MFRKYAILHWILFWVVSCMVYFAETNFMPYDVTKPTDTMILGNYFWAGLTVVIVFGVIEIIIKRVKRVVKHG